MLKTLLAASAVAAALIAPNAVAQDQPPFGTPEEVDDAVPAR